MKAKDKEKYWEKRANINFKKGKTISPTLGLLAGGCPSCGHCCDYEKWHCSKCGWNPEKERRYGKNRMKERWFNKQELKEIAKMWKV
jgi:hypothetical protein